MTRTHLPPPTTARRRAARDREFWRVRIPAMVQAGWSYAAIGREEAISRERLLAKLNSMAEHVKRRRELHGDAPPGATTRHSPRPPLTRRKPLTHKTYSVPKA